MSSLANQVYGDFARASFDADAAAAAFFRQRGFSGVFVRNGVGDYSLTLQDACSLPQEACIKCGLNSAAAGMIAVECVSSTVIRVRTLSAAAAATDIDFWIEISKIGPN